ncbi:LysR family transcriptional regulator [Wenxinia marina]|uniref:Transcriptional regulator n=1 Tax=Wenxinia marina DSM 24838 TaxID=1123501 RepID=A0A0D0NIB7_9RHOB|nr:LysR family transcriptional regulator [Wenxinia marina]KIQ68070.1 Transcriptional regulator [Wenxinia marina DSM 24838]GGL77971.1 transcriptional regulator [Wenxinia marina]
MIPRNLRHLRVFAATAATGSVTRAAERCLVTQSAVTQALAKLEAAAGEPLFRRTPAGFAPTEAGALLSARVDRALALLSPALAAVAPRLEAVATTSQLTALAAVAETRSFTRAAERLGLAQPTVHRAITQLERAAGRPLLDRTPHGLAPRRAAEALARAVRLAFAEIDQAEAELAEARGGSHGRIVLGTLPLARAAVLPEALARFRQARPGQAVSLVEGSYDELLAGLRGGTVDVIVGALRDPLPAPDVTQEELFRDGLSLLVGNHHPLARLARVAPSDLADRSWVLPRPGAPARAQFDAWIAGIGPVAGIVETGSVLMMRELLARSDLIGCVSTTQSAAEVAHGLMTRLDVTVGDRPRPIGLTTRTGWIPTPPQRLLLDLVRAAAAERNGG